MKYYTITEISAETGIKRRTIKYLVETGKIKAKRIKGTRIILIPEEEIKKMIEEYKPLQGNKK